MFARKMRPNLIFSWQAAWQTQVVDSLSIVSVIDLGLTSIYKLQVLENSFTSVCTSVGLSDSLSEAVKKNTNFIIFNLKVYLWQKKERKKE